MLNRRLGLRLGLTLGLGSELGLGLASELGIISRRGIKRGGTKPEVKVRFKV